MMYDENIKSLRLCADECEEDCEGCSCDICKYAADCHGISAGPNGPIYPPCENGMERCVDESIAEYVWEERNER